MRFHTLPLHISPHSADNMVEAHHMEPRADCLLLFTALPDAHRPAPAQPLWVTEVARCPSPGPAARRGLPAVPFRPRHLRSRSREPHTPSTTAHGLCARAAPSLRLRGHPRVGLTCGFLPFLESEVTCIKSQDKGAVEEAAARSLVSPCAGEGAWGSTTAATAEHNCD